MRVKVVGIMGSPRRGGNTEQLLDRVLEGAKGKGAEVDKIVVCKYSISPCQECAYCLEEGKCKTDDDMQEIYPKLLETDALIVASPVFFKGVSAQLKVLIDRCQCLWAKKYVLRQPLRDEEKLDLKGVFISVGGLKNPKTFDGAILTVKSFFHVLEIPYHEQLVYPAVNGKGEIKNVKGALDKAFEVGQSLVSKGKNR